MRGYFLRADGIWAVQVVLDEGVDTGLAQCQPSRKERYGDPTFTVLLLRAERTAWSSKYESRLKLACLRSDVAAVVPFRHPGRPQDGANALDVNLGFPDSLAKIARPPVRSRLANTLVSAFDEEEGAGALVLSLI